VTARNFLEHVCQTVGCHGVMVQYDHIMTGLENSENNSGLTLKK